MDASSPATAVDAVDELTALVAAVDAEMADSWGCNSYHPTLRPALEAARRTALQASRPPVTQQAVAEGADTARAFIEWCKAQPEDRVPVSIDEALDEFEKHLATKEQCS